jgi:hypothetical protein
VKLRTLPVEVVRETVAEAVERELAFLDHDVARRVGTGEDAVLVVMEVRIAHREVAPFLPDAGAVSVGNGRAGELDVVDGGGLPLDHPDGLAFGRAARRIQHRAAVDAADDEAVAQDRAHVAGVVAGGVDLDHIVVGGGCEGLAGRGEHSARADRQGRRVSGGQRRDDGRRHGERMRVAHGRLLRMHIARMILAAALQPASPGNTCEQPSCIARLLCVDATGEARTWSRSPTHVR